MAEEYINEFTFHPRFSKNVHNLDCPVVFPPHGPENRKQKQKHETVPSN